MLERAFGERCDDGNIMDGDGCSADCGALEGCGNGRMESGEECDESTVSLWRAAEEPVTFPVDGTCDTAYLGDSAYWTAISYDANTPTGGSCDPSGGVPGGSVEAEMQITFCCT